LDRDCDNTKLIPTIEFSRKGYNAFDKTMLFREYIATLYVPNDG